MRINDEVEIIKCLDRPDCVGKTGIITDEERRPVANGNAIFFVVEYIEDDGTKEAWFRPFELKVI